MSYKLHTNKNWLQTRSEISDQMRLWGIDDFLVEKIDSAARLTYMKDGHTIELLMDKQQTANDNLRVLFLAVESLRLNEVRGIADTVQNAYLQLAAPPTKRNPYEVLGIYPDSDLEIAEAVFKKKALKLHPDQGGDPEKFKELNEAIEVIRRAAR